MEDKNSNEKAIYIHSYNDVYADVNVLSAGFEITTKEKPPRRWDDFSEFSIHCVTNGKGYYTIRGKEYPVEKNTIFCIFPNEPLEYRPDPKTPWTYYWMNFTGSKAAVLLRRSGASPENPLISFKDPRVVKYFTRTIVECKYSPELADLISLSNLYKIFSVLATKQSAPKKKLKLSDKALDYISQNYQNPNLTIQAVATHLNISASYLSRVLKQETQMNFTEHLLSYRIKVATGLINNESPASITDIATQVGFLDPYYFSKAFKKHHGITPSKLIKELKHTHTPPPPPGWERKGKK